MYYLYIPYLKTFAHEQIKPELRFQAFVIYKNNKVVECNERAFRKGIIPGMNILEARKKTYTLSLAAYNEALYTECRNSILQLLYTRAPYIEPDNGVAAFFSTKREIRHIDREEFVHDLHLFLTQNVNTSIRIGYGKNKTIAYIAGRLSHINGHLIIEDHIAAKFITMLPLSLLPGIGKRTARMLSGFGLQTIGQFVQQPIQQIVSLFGISGLQLFERASAIDARPLISNFKPTTYSKSAHIPSKNVRDTYTTFYSLLSSLRDTLIDNKTKPISVSVALTSHDKKIYSQNKKIIPKSYVQLTRNAFNLFQELLHKVEKPKKITLLVGVEIVQRPQVRANQKQSSGLLHKGSTVFDDLFSSLSFSSPH